MANKIAYTRHVQGAISVASHEKYHRRHAEQQRNSGRDIEQATDHAMIILLDLISRQRSGRFYRSKKTYRGGRKGTLRIALFLASGPLALCGKSALASLISTISSQGHQRREIEQSARITDHTHSSRTLSI